MVKKRRRLELRKTLFLLPNLITLSSIFCGFDSIRISATAKTEDDFYRAALLIVFAMFFDTLDGRVARMTKTQSAFGLQIDSLADVVAFGVAPSLLVYQWTLHRFETVGLVAAFLFTALGAVRLARFNVLSMGEGGKPTKPSKYIVGLPIPGAAGILVSIVVANHAAGGMIGGAEYAAGILGITVVLSLFMVSTIRFRSFKDMKVNAWTVGLVAFAVGSSVLISTQLKPAFVLVWLLGVYVMIGICESLWQLPGRLRGVRSDARASMASLPPRDSVPPGAPPAL
ncbi:CDP-diacylglycerol--serine O-phosphatidyltransferase [Chondromyces apiculatus]|uniref:CDP-diacylglycerol--serine O-phosphatidyltransferase n=1 Tax=Chondromyces apiculatus DSM 436 TaxID=1192034 RepID=A0A017T0P1_9BACT|nr:CDP-diacylglycerol--serine O-phosphatidyltransferase [Chondromyces apiculatus]EYF02430.1 CDP-diacylglycerol--serine O-phosphatidyltransferase [Chondromyces apiculatus DSM 436]